MIFPLSVRPSWQILSVGDETFYSNFFFLCFVYCNPKTLSKNEANFSGCPGGKGFKADKSIDCNVSTRVL